MSYYDDNSFASDDQFSVSNFEAEFVFDDNRNEYLSDEPTVSHDNAAWQFCSSEEGLWIDENSDPELLAKLDRQAGLDSFGNKVTPESSKARLEKRAQEIYHGRVTILSNGYCGTVSIYCHECCDYYRLKNKTLLAGSTACKCVSDRNDPLPADDTLAYVYPLERQQSWCAGKHEVKQREQAERAARRETKRKPVNRLEKWSTTMDITFRETNTLFHWCDETQGYYAALDKTKQD